MAHGVVAFLQSRAIPSKITEITCDAIAVREREREFVATELNGLVRSDPIFSRKKVGTDITLLRSRGQEKYSRLWFG